MIVGIFLIRLGIAVVFWGFGIHQFLFPAIWKNYIPTELKEIWPVISRVSVVHLSGINIILSIFLLSGFFPLLSAWCAFVWQITALPFHFAKNWRLGIQEIGLSICVFALVFLLS